MVELFIIKHIIFLPQSHTKGTELKHNASCSFGHWYSLHMKQEHGKHKCQFVFFLQHLLVIQILVNKQRF